MGVLKLVSVEFLSLLEMLSSAVHAPNARHSHRWHWCILSFISHLLHSSHPCYQLRSWFCLQLCLLSVMLSSSLDGFCRLLGTPGEELVQWSRMCLRALKPVLGNALEFPHLLLKISKRGYFPEAGCKVSIQPSGRKLLNPKRKRCKGQQHTFHSHQARGVSTGKMLPFDDTGKDRRSMENNPREVEACHGTLIWYWCQWKAGIGRSHFSSESSRAQEVLTSQLW